MIFLFIYFLSVFVIGYFIYLLFNNKEIAKATGYIDKYSGLNTEGIFLLGLVGLIPLFNTIAVIVGGWYVAVKLIKPKYKEDE